MTDDRGNLTKIDVANGEIAEQELIGKYLAQVEPLRRENTDCVAVSDYDSHCCFVVKQGDLSVAAEIDLPEGCKVAWGLKVIPELDLICLNDFVDQTYLYYAKTLNLR